MHRSTQGNTTNQRMVVDANPIAEPARAASAPELIAHLGQVSTGLARSTRPIARDGRGRGRPIASGKRRLRASRNWTTGTCRIPKTKGRGMRSEGKRRGHRQRAPDRNHADRSSLNLHIPPMQAIQCDLWQGDGLVPPPGLRRSVGLDDVRGKHPGRINPVAGCQARWLGRLCHVSPRPG